MNVISFDLAKLLPGSNRISLPSLFTAHIYGKLTRLVKKSFINSLSPKVAPFSFLQVASAAVLARVTDTGMDGLLTVLSLHTKTNTHIHLVFSKNKSFL